MKPRIVPSLARRRFGMAFLLLAAAAFAPGVLSAASQPQSASDLDARARAQEIERLAAELREGDPWPAIREERIETLLPRAMDAAEVDAWLVLCRENANDPLAKHVGGEGAGSLAAYLFLRSGTGVERVIVVSENEVITLRERFPKARVVPTPGGGSVFALLAEELRRASPARIAVNRSDLAAADGLTATQDAALRSALGPDLERRLTSSEELVIRWLGVKAPAEIEIMKRGTHLTDLLEREAFEWVVPGETSNGDLHRAMRARIEGLGLGHSWSSNPGITTGLDRGRGSDLNRIIKPGDLINIDAGVALYDIWHTDIQRFAYVLKPGEIRPPDSIQYAWESAKLSSRKMLEAMRPGAKGWEVDKVQIEWQEERGSLRHWASSGHPVGYWTHDVGPSISGYDPDGPPPTTGRAARELEVGMMFGYDGNYVWPAVDDGVEGTKSITIEEGGLVTEAGGEYLSEPQEELVVIPTGGFPRAFLGTERSTLGRWLDVHGRGDGAAGVGSLEDALQVVTPGLLKSHVRFLAHDLLRGRDTGDRGYRLAAEYAAAQYTRIGLEPWDGESYLQPFDLLEATEDLGSELRSAGVRIGAEGARFSPEWTEGRDAWDGDGVYVGYGLATHGRDDYRGVDVGGKVVFLLQGAPEEWQAHRDSARAANAKVEIALRRGAALVVELQTPRSPQEPAPVEAPGNPRRVMALADGTAPRVGSHVVVSPVASWRLLSAWGIDPASAERVAVSGAAPEAVGPVRVVRHHRLEGVKSWNVVGIVRGTDPARRDESIVFSSHLDHVGIGPPNEHGDTINNGAHDNAIGSAKLLAAAEAMVRLRPRRSVVFALVGAEERGLFGSWYYVRNPALPIEGAVANINQDGGRENEATDDVIVNAADVSDVDGIVREVMAGIGVGVMDRDRATSSQVGFSSDHYPFLLAGVPPIDLKPGHTVAGDEDWQRGLRDRLRYYSEWRHRPADNFDERTFTMESAAEMAKRSVHLAWHLSEMEGRPELNRDQALWRERSQPERPYYFGPGYEF